MSKRYLVFVLCFIACTISSAQQGLPDAQEIERRNAASSFVMSRETLLMQLHHECLSFWSTATPSMKDVSTKWVERNRSDLDASAAWLDHYFSVLKRDAPKLFESQTTALLREVANSNEKMIAVYFRGGLPDSSRCVWAAKSYEAPLDFQTMASVPGYETFAEYPQTLRRIRNEPWYGVREPAEKRFERSLKTSANQRSPILLAAATSAGLQGNEKLRLAIFETMAGRGDGLAAQSIALAHYTGGTPGYPQNFGLAFRWFYQAWALSQPEGLNGMGVMLRDGTGVTKNPELAFAAFSVSKVMAKTRDALTRATDNVTSVESSVPEASQRRVACMSLASFDKALELSLAIQPAVTLKRPFQSPERRLGEMSKDLAPYLATGACTEAGTSVLK